MAVLSITASLFRNVNCGTARAIAGEAITRGQYIYVDSVSGKAWLSTRAGTAFASRTAGVATADVAAGQELVYLLPGGDFVPGGTLLAGVAYYLGATAGAVESSKETGIPASTNYGTIVFIAKSTTVARLLCEASDAALA